MNEAEKKIKEQEYSNCCAKLGDLIITQQIIAFDIENVTTKCKELLREIKDAKSPQGA